jgi:hypothetical protein
VALQREQEQRPPPVGGQDACPTLQFVQKAGSLGFCIENKVLPEPAVCSLFLRVEGSTASLRRTVSDSRRRFSIRFKVQSPVRVVFQVPFNKHND